MQSPFRRTPEQHMFGLAGQGTQIQGLAQAQRRMADAETERQYGDTMATLPYTSATGGWDRVADYQKQKKESDLARNAYNAARMEANMLQGLRSRYADDVNATNRALIRGYQGAGEREQMNAERGSRQSALGQTLQVLRALLDPAASMTPGNQSLLASLMGPDTNIDFRGNQNQQIGGMTASARPVSSMYRYNW